MITVVLCFVAPCVLPALPACVDTHTLNLLVYPILLAIAAFSTAAWNPSTERYILPALRRLQRPRTAVAWW